ncbi:tetratricopeptide repeat protein [Paludibaculum fermentans]|uniref:tetratricopeptide repeat protein n=1 Tax=Paludibaculum fermentans TaxID=1473598 RepID=UPI003EBDFD51
MANAEGVNPSRHEVERQLDRLLADDVIASNPNPAKVLRYIVERALGGHKIAELNLLEDVFGKTTFDEDDTTARGAMDRLRRLLKDYYQRDGQYDPVIVALPDTKQTAEGKRIKFQAGEAYTPFFVYNPRSWMARELTVAFHLLRGGISQIDQAMAQFDKVARAAPGHPEVKLGVVESWAIKLLTGIAGGPDEALVAGPLIWLKQIEKDAGPSWRTHNVRAMLHFFMDDRKAAAKEFGKALKLDRKETVSRGGYTEFLFRTGREDQALRLMALEAEEHADNAQVHAMYAIHLARVRRYEEAEKVFAKSLLLDPNGWTAHFGLWEMYLALGDQKKADDHSNRLAALITPHEFAFLRRKLLGEQA